jgi:tetratricopeptide (TPR) repeat protein
MPKARAHDGGHTVFTDHSIPRKSVTASHRAEPSELVAFYGRSLSTAIASRNLGLAYASIGALEKAWPLLRAAAQSKPPDAALYAQIGMLLEADGRLEQAAEFYRLSLDLDRSHPTALPRLGVLLARRGAAEEARRMLEAALRVNPRQPEVRKALATLR